MRRELWGYAPDEDLDNEALIAEAYRGIRPAPGYPACPDHTKKGELFRTLGVTDAIGLQLTESFAMVQRLERYGVKFEKDEHGEYAVRRVHRSGSYVLPMPEGKGSG